MSVAKAIVNRPVLWLVVFVLISISGFFMVSNIAVEKYPEVQMPYLVISTTYSGADPETVEKSVTNVLEAAIANTGGIQKMTSTSRSQSSLIILQFDFGTNMDVKTNRVRESIDRVKNMLPDNLASPIIMQLRPEDQPIMRIAVRGNTDSVLSQNDLRSIAKNELEDQFKQIEGIASVNVEGGQDSIVRVSLSQNRLEAYGVTITEIARSLTAQNRELGAGFIEEGLIEYSIKTSGEFSSLAEIANTVVLQIGGADIRLQDIGEVSFDFEEERSTVYVNGEPGVYLSIIKQSGANTVKVADQVYKRLKNLKKTLPKEINLEITQDDTLQTRAMLNELVNSAMSGVILAMLIVILFLRNINGSIIIGLAIPLSFLITLLVMALSNITINMMTLAGLILGLGMTVDCSIVVLESVMVYREKGEKPTLAAILAGEEVMSSLIASTITTISVFIPIILFKNRLEIVGIIVQDMVFTICVSVVASLFIGIFLVPVLASKWLPVHSRLQKPLRNPLIKKIDTCISNIIQALTNGYQWLLSKALKHRVITVFLVVCLFLGSAFAMTRLDITMLPPEDGDTVVLNIEMSLGTRYEETKAVALEIQEFAIAEINGVKNIMTNIGSTGTALSGSTGTNTASITVVLDLNAPNVDSDEAAKDKLRSHFAEFPNAVFSFSSLGLARLLGGSDIDIVLRADDLAEGIATAGTIQSLLENGVPEVQDISLDIDEGLPQVNVNIDRNRAYNMGLNVASIASEIAASMNGVTATTFMQMGDQYNVVLQLAKEDRYELPDLGRIFVRSSNGRLFPISNFASFEKTHAPVSINHEGQARIIHITAVVKEGYSIKKVETKIGKILDEQGIQATFAGSSQSTQNMMQTFILVIILALLLVYGVMAAQYESFIDPLINFCTIPLLLIGIVLIHIFTGQTMSAFTMIGIVLLAGVVVNNGILLVDYTNQLVRKGKSVMEACLEAGGNRFRPVLMTALTTMLGLAPMAFFPGSSSRITSPIGLVVFGGLASATVITLVFIPVLYSLVHNKKGEIKNEE